MPIVTNKKGGKVVFRAAANTTLSLADLRKDEGETVLSATLTQIWVSSEGTSGGCVYYRGAVDANNLCFRAVSGENDYSDFAGNGVKVDDDLKDQNIIFVVPNSTTIVVAEFHKNSTFTSEY